MAERKAAKKVAKPAPARPAATKATTKPPRPPPRRRPGHEGTGEGDGEGAREVGHQARDRRPPGRSRRRRGLRRPCPARPERRGAPKAVPAGEPDIISVRGAREHNLRDIDIDLPRDRLVVITGLSGSGKCSLAFDTIYAEGQRRYVESL